jgi:hypothetical protein
VQACLSLATPLEMRAELWTDCTSKSLTSFYRLAREATSFAPGSLESELQTSFRTQLGLEHYY